MNKPVHCNKSVATDFGNSVPALTWQDMKQNVLNFMIAELGDDIAATKLIDDLEKNMKNKKHELSNLPNAEKESKLHINEKYDAFYVIIKS